MCFFATWDSTERQATRERGPVGSSATKRETKRTNVKDRWTAHNEKGNGTERTKTRVGNGRRHRRDGNAEQATHEETGNETDGTEMSVYGLTTRRENGRLERKRWVSSAQWNGKTERNGRETIKQRAGRSGSTMLANHSNKLNQTN